MKLVGKCWLRDCVEYIIVHLQLLFGVKSYCFMWDKTQFYGFLPNVYSQIFFALEEQNTQGFFFLIFFIQIVNRLRIAHVILIY